MRAERIRVGDEYYLLAAALPARGRHLVLNHGDSFVVLNEAGDIPLAGAGPYGLFRNGTRFLDRFELRVNAGFPLVLTSTLSDDCSEQTTYLTNPDERRSGEVVVQRDVVALRRCKVLTDGVLFETLEARNFCVAPVDLTLAVLFTTDFADVFELRGVVRQQRGKTLPARIEATAVRLGYVGLDGVERGLRLTFSPGTWQLEPESAVLQVRLAPEAELRTSITAHCEVGTSAVQVGDLPAALATVRKQRQDTRACFARITSSNASLDQWIEASLRDLALLCTWRSEGVYPYAGIPWFATIFGRDGLLTAFEALAFAPALAAGALRALAGLQGRETNTVRDEEPGKILHELRLGEMAATGEIPFGRYYGSIDATPLFLGLLAAYAHRTADLELVRGLWPTATAALEWIRRSLDQRGFLSYERRAAKGLINQGWKDSHDAISHASGDLARPPIALCEVQGYVYAALDGMAHLARRLGDAALAQRCESEALALRQRFDHHFWLEEEGTYALALDGSGQPCRVIASNPGHCLLTGIAAPAAAARVVASLMHDDCFSGWGIRTLSAAARRYNPMSYHNGSVWPHDNALIAAGFARYGYGAQATALLSAVFDASMHMEDRRLPELFCGFARVEHEQPVSYPTACRPQAWAAGSVFLLLQAALGLSIDGWKRRVTFTRAVLPEWLDHLEIRGLRVGPAALDVRVTRGRRSAAFEVIDRHGDLDVIVAK